MHVTRAKTDQNAEGALVGIPHASRRRLCAVAAIDAWRIRLAALLDVDPAELGGPLFRPVDRRGRLGQHVYASVLSLGATGPPAQVRPLVEHLTDPYRWHPARRQADLPRSG